MTDGDAAPEKRPSRPVRHYAGATSLTSIGVIVVAVALLQLGQDILVPFAVAMLLSFVLGPLVNRLRAWRVPRVPAVLLTVAFAFVVISVFSVVVSRQVVSLAENITLYQDNLEAKIRSLRDAVPSGGVIERTTEAVKELREDLREATEEEQEKPEPEDADEPEPVPVEIKGVEQEPMEVLMNVVGPVLGPLATGGVVIVLAIFMLLEKEDLRDRLIRIMGTRDLHRTTEALNDAAQRVSRYLLAQLFVNASYGIALGAGLWLIGVPNPALWGLIAAVLRFIPYVGPIVAACFPLAMAVAASPDWTLLAWTAGLILVIELISNNVVEPLLYGHSTGVSTVAIIFAAVFWTWVWGPIGLLLSTPLTVCLVVLGRYIPQMRLFNILFGSEPVLTAAERFYQRLLADDTGEALDIVEEHLAEQPMAEMFDEVILPALRLADSDRRRGVLEPGRVTAIAAAVRHIVDTLAEQPKKNVVAPARVLCVALRTELDAVTAHMLEALLRPAGYAVDVLGPREAMAGARLARPDVICPCLLQMATRAQAERIWHRYAWRLPDAPVVLATWDEREEDGVSEPLAPTCFKKIVDEIDAKAVPQTAEQRS